MSLISRDLARVLGSTAIALVLTGAVAKAEPAVTMDGAAYRYSAGGTDTTSGNTFEAATSGPTKRAWGMLVYNGSIANVSDTTVITSGAKAHGIQVGAKGGNADGADHSTINLGNGVNVTTGGNDSYGLHAIDGGNISGTATVGTTGARAYGAFAESFSTIDLTGGSITTSGSLAYGLLANNDMNTVGGKITATDVDIDTSSSWTFGAYAKNGGEITLNGGSITTTGERAYGILASNGGIVSSSADIKTTFDKTHGIQAGEDANNPGGRVILTGGSVTTDGVFSVGLHAVQGGTIQGNTTITTNGVNGHGAFAESDSTIALNNSAITTRGDTAYGLHANNDKNTVGGKITAVDTVITTNGVHSYGAFADNGGQISLTGGSITTANEKGKGTQDGDGSRGYALFSQGNGSLVSAEGTAIHTLGQRAYGAYALNGGDVDLKNVSITTEGFMAYGVYASGAGSVLNAENVNITTSGDVGDAAWAYAGGILNLKGGTYNVLGEQNSNSPHENANGLIAVGGTATTDGGIINAENLVINTTGADSYGFRAGAVVGADETSGTIKLKNTTITASGENAYIGQVQYGSTLTVSDSTLKSERGIGIGLTDSADVTLNNTSIISGKETFESTFSKSGQTQNVSLGNGTVATQNDGTLLKVNRSEAGGDGIVNLNLRAGSTSSGDIVDTDITKTTGVTNVKVEQGATYNGRIEGITDLDAESGTDLTFEAGTEIAGNLTGTSSTFTFDPTGANIGGDVALNDGSSTHGGSINSPIIVGGSVLVDPTSILGGNWDIAGNLSANGMITPGNSIGVVKVGGDATFGADSVYAVEIAGDGTSDRIDVTGKATLQGGRVDVYALDNKVSYQDGQTYTILTAGGGVDGEFSEAASKSVFLTAELEHLSNQVDLKVGLVADPVDPENPPVVFEKVAQTNNQIATARALDSLEQSGSSLELYNSVLFLASEEEARDAFNQLSGDTHASVKTGLIDTANLTADAINNRLRSAFEGVAAKDAPVLSFAQSPKGSAPQPFDAVAPASYDYGVWASGFGSWVEHDGNASTGGLKSTTGGFLSGVDVGFASGWRLGVVGGYSQTDLDAKGRFASATSDNWHLGVYGGNQWGPIGLRAGLVHTWHSIDSSRSVAYTGFSDSLDADYDARTFQAFGELGYRIDMAAASFEPFANLSHVRLHTDGFTEKGDAAALSVNGETTSTTFTTLGLRASAPLQLGPTTANLKGTLGWRHAYGDITPESTQYFAGSNAFTVEGVAIAKDAALVEAGFDLAITEASTFGVSYVGQFGNDTTQNGFNATLNVKF
ncbi:autotransporter domain-containing protein [Brucella sp. NBRC 113783]|uniref:autotransporter domain-containing protein n=1 Tax=Brucella sp. NBRC 113783 TaxID=3075478 RepID=UPI0029BFBD81|nr:autotransporter domain-containing protein [Brucella sp. NBRC 113783]MDX4075562.1 autotransporter domain-containing protein [Brucella sp. NBRC 113783]